MFYAEQVFLGVFTILALYILGGLYKEYER